MNSKLWAVVISFLFIVGAPKAADAKSANTIFECGLAWGLKMSHTDLGVDAFDQNFTPNYDRYWTVFFDRHKRLFSLMTSLLDVAYSIKTEPFRNQLLAIIEDVKEARALLGVAPIESQAGYERQLQIIRKIAEKMHTLPNTVCAN